MQQLEVLTTADWRVEAQLVDMYGAPIDLSGASLLATVAFENGSVIANISLGGGLTILDGPAGLIEIALNRADRTLAANAVTERTIVTVDLLRLVDEGGDEYVEWAGRFLLAIVQGFAEWQ
jgi:hypothetical protein